MPPPTEPGVVAPMPTDSELALLARDAAPASAAALALFDRRAASLRRFVGRWVRGRRLHAADVEDAVQEGAVAFLEAVARFDPGRRRASVGDPFRRFLRRVLRRRLGNWLRGRRRAERGLDRTRDPAEARDERSSREAGGPFAWRAGDPAALAERADDRRRLAGLLAGLGDEARRLWEGRCEDRGLSALADETGRPYAQIRRLWQKVLAFLRRAFGMTAPPLRSGRGRGRGGRVP